MCRYCYYCCCCCCFVCQPDGTTALMAAAQNNHLDCVLALLAAGCAVDLMDRRGWSALTRAAVNGHTAVCEALCAAGAVGTNRCHEGLTPAQWARARGHTDTADLVYTMTKPPTPRPPTPPRRKTPWDATPDPRHVAAFRREQLAKAIKRGSSRDLPMRAAGTGSFQGNGPQLPVDNGCPQPENRSLDASPLPPQPATARAAPAAPAAPAPASAAASPAAATPLAGAVSAQLSFASSPSLPSTLGGGEDSVLPPAHAATGWSVTSVSHSLASVPPSLHCSSMFVDGGSEGPLRSPSYMSTRLAPRDMERTRTVQIALSSASLKPDSSLEELPPYGLTAGSSLLVGQEIVPPSFVPNTVLDYSTAQPLGRHSLPVDAPPPVSAVPVQARALAGPPLTVSSLWDTRPRRKLPWKHHVIQHPTPLERLSADVAQGSAAGLGFRPLPSDLGKRLAEQRRREAPPPADPAPQEPAVSPVRPKPAALVKLASGVRKFTSMLSFGKKGKAGRK